MRKFHCLIPILLLAAATPVAAQTTYQADIIIYGATSGGVASAVQAVREGKTVELIATETHIGGMTSGGLGWVDGGDKSTVGGISGNFFNTYADLSTNQTGFTSGSNPWTLTPGEALGGFLGLLAAEGITVRTNNRLLRGGSGVIKTGNRITSIVMENGSVFEGRVFIDATYEGDLMAEAGVSYTIGRESADTYGESKAGVLGPSEPQGHSFDVFIDPYVVPGDPGSGLLPDIQPGPLGEIGSGDSKLQAYNFRVCLTRSSDPADRVEITEPPNYDPDRYEMHRRYIVARSDAGLPTVLKEDLLKISAAGDLKTDINNKGPVSLNLIGRSWQFPEADYATRDALIQEHVDYSKGLFWFLKSDPAVPAAIRNDMAAFAYPADEYTTNGNWSPQLYVREARRMIGPYVMTQNDIPGLKWDAIGQGSYRFDSHHVQRVIFPADYGNASAGQLQNEGNYLATYETYDIPYRSIVPKRIECDNLLVTFCVSASHIAFSSIRMEPVFMILGQSAATAASLAIDADIAVQDVDYAALRAKLLADGQALSPQITLSTALIKEDFRYGETVSTLAGLNGGSGWGGPWEAGSAPGRIKYIPGEQLSYPDQGIFYGDSAAPAGVIDGLAQYQDGGSHIIARPFSDTVGGTIWISALVELTGIDRAFIWLNSRASESNGNSTHFFGIDHTEEGRLLMRFENNNLYADAPIVQNQPLLFLARVDIDSSGTFDEVRFWFNPDLSGGESGLGAPDLQSTDILLSNALGSGLSSIGVQLEKVDPLGQGSKLDALRISNRNTGFGDVTSPYVQWADERGVTDPFTDSDRDGENDGNEYLAGSNPNLAASVFKVRSFDFSPASNEYELVWNSLRDPEDLEVTYTVYENDSLNAAENSWTILQDNIAPQGSETSVTIPLSLPPNQQKFYRVGASRNP